MRVLITGWFAFPNGEATAGDVGAARTVSAALHSAGIEHDIAWSPMFRNDGPTLAEADPDDYDHLVFVCGPAHGWQVRRLHERFARCTRIAVGVSVIDPDDDAVRGFHTVIARDRPGGIALPDLATAAPREPSVPVVGIVTAPAQPEYGHLSGHTEIHDRLSEWIVTKDCARVPLDTRLDTRDWRHCATTAQFDSLLRRIDLVVTTRLHGLVLALRNGVPAIAVDPVIGGAKVRAQARAFGWPVIVVDRPGDPPPPRRLDELWNRFLSPAARGAVDGDATSRPWSAQLVDELLDRLTRALPLEEYAAGSG
ncbi:MAG: polysaccharide pyruvyl transferase family protein [Nocardiopsaceae bacterium]|nr:polysaccharide pyruvyl transferase family protein [Nocardiopsaceae bacterium]